jgi:hypothetical protein
MGQQNQQSGHEFSKVNYKEQSESMVRIVKEIEQ